MIEAQELITIDLAELFGKCAELKFSGYRLVQVCCSNLGEGMVELSYSFDKDYHFMTVRTKISKEEEVESIQVIYESAYLYENEISDLFGIKVKNMQVDFKGGFYKTSKAAPFAQAEKKDEGGKN